MGGSEATINAINTANTTTSRYNAPAVAYPLASPWLERVLLGALWLAGLLTVGVWLDLTQSWRNTGLVFTGIGAVVLAALAQVAQKKRGFGRTFLVWDGQHWHCSRGHSVVAAEPDSAAVPDAAVFVVLDFQVLLLVCLAGGGAKRWVWLWRGSQPDQWLALRRALAARARQALA